MSRQVVGDGGKALIRKTKGERMSVKKMNQAKNTKDQFKTCNKTRKASIHIYLRLGFRLAPHQRSWANRMMQYGHNLFHTNTSLRIVVNDKNRSIRKLTCPPLPALTNNLTRSTKS